MSQQRAPYLTVVGREGGEVRRPGAVPDGSGAGDQADGAGDGRKAQAFALALMYACVSWVALVREEAVEGVDITPIGQLSYEVEVRLAGGARVLLRVGLKVEPGLVVRTVVEPARP